MKHHLCIFDFNDPLKLCWNCLQKMLSCPSRYFLIEVLLPYSSSPWLICNGHLYDQWMCFLSNSARGMCLKFHDFMIFYSFPYWLINSHQYAKYNSNFSFHKCMLAWNTAKVRAVCWAPFIKSLTTFLSYWFLYVELLV